MLHLTNLMYTEPVMINCATEYNKITIMIKITDLYLEIMQ